MSLPLENTVRKARLQERGLRTKEERDLVVAQVVQESALKSLGVAAIATGLNLAANWRYKTWRKLRWPVKATIVVWSALGSFGYFAEDTMTRKDIQYSSKFSAVAVPSGNQGVDPISQIPLSERLSWKDAKDYAIKNRYEIVGTAWFTTALGTVLYLWRKPIPISDKLINARLYAQSLGLAGLFGFAFAATLKSEEVSKEDTVNNDHYEAVLNQKNAAKA